MNIKLTKTERLLLYGGLIGMASLMLQACETVMKENEDEREKICGNWESAEGKPDILVYREGTLYKVTLFRRSGVRAQAEAGRPTCSNGRRTATSYMNTGFRIDVAYNEETDVLTLSPNGDYIRVDTDDTSDGEKKEEQ
ncbi:Conjugative transposon protein TraH [Phocaeicola vulgatus]|uniref:Conjugative transposon protein TraH n=1 Tax=Phocaeicola vulgatus TaxID=821 RepID=A0A0P0M1H1_PHOVU|nr:Conjugative transposon protein TraH [Phocaeicola vulgatus]